MLATNQRNAGCVLSKSELRHGKAGRRQFKDIPRRPVMLVLDGVTQHYNIGAIFRLCDAFLVARIVICGAAFEPRKRSFVQAARGTQGWMPYFLHGDAKKVVSDVRSDGWQIVAVEQTTNGVPPEKLDTRFPVCLVLGSERGGVSKPIVEMADAAITIPMYGMANSINVATAAAIVLHHLTALSYARGL